MTVDYTGVRHGALTVIETPRSRADLNTRLQALHAGLFVERQLRQDELRKPYPVWCVCLDTGREGIACIYEWRDPDGNPIDHLSDRLVDEIERRYRRGPISMQQIVLQNERLKERAKREYAEETEQLIDEHFPLASGQRLPILQRGVGLRMARDKRRARGEKC